jgi:hypothetical protein
MDNLPAFVPELEVRGWDGRYSFRGKKRCLVPREEATRSLVSSLNSLANTTEEFWFFQLYFEKASIWALQQNLDRLFEEGNPLNQITFGGECHGDAEMALCVLFESKCQYLVLIQQCITFTPALAETLSRSASLVCLVIHQLSLDKAEMERLALCLCANSSIRILRLNKCFQGDESMVEFAKRLPGMTHLRSLSLSGNEFGKAGDCELVRVLEEGVHSLETLNLVRKPTSLQNYVNFLLWLKKNGGRPAISSSSMTKWIELLTYFKTDQDASALYFTICSDPGRFKNLSSRTA